MTDDFEVGDKVTITERYSREHTPVSRSPCAVTAIWEVKQIPVKDCVYIGIRYLNNGRIDYDRDEGSQYRHGKTFKARLLVSLCGTKKPFYAPYDSMTKKA